MFRPAFVSYKLLNRYPCRACALGLGGFGPGPTVNQSQLVASDLGGITAHPVQYYGKPDAGQVISTGVYTCGVLGLSFADINATLAAAFAAAVPVLPHAVAMQESPPGLSPEQRWVPLDLI